MAYRRIGVSLFSDTNPSTLKNFQSQALDNMSEGQECFSCLSSTMRRCFVKTWKLRGKRKNRDQFCGGARALLCEKPRWKRKHRDGACSHCGLQRASRAGNRDQTDMETAIKVRMCAQVQGARRTLMWFGRGAVCITAFIDGVPFLRKTEMEAQTQRWSWCMCRAQNAETEMGTAETYMGGPCPPFRVVIVCL